MSGRFSRSWAIFKSSATVLKQNKKLLVFPLLSSVAALLVMGSFGVTYAWWGGYADTTSGEQTTTEPIIYFLTYLVLYSVVIFFNTALVAAVVRYMDGGEPTIGYGLRVAWSKIGNVLGYASIAATVGVILKVVEERLGFIGQIVAGLLGLAWTVTTFLVVPVLVHRDIGPLDAVKESAVMLKKTWGENIIANAGMALIFTLFYVPLILIILVTTIMIFSGSDLSAGFSERIIASSMLALSLLVLVLLVLIHAALQSIYGTALYRYAANAQDVTAARNFSPDLLGSAFIPKRK